MAAINGDFENRYIEKSVEVRIPGYDERPDETDIILSTLEDHNIEPFIVEVDIFRTRIVVWSDEYIGIEGLKRYLERRRREKEKIEGANNAL